MVNIGICGVNRLNYLNDNLVISTNVILSLTFIRSHMHTRAHNHTYSIIAIIITPMISSYDGRITIELSYGIESVVITKQ
jgi:hypothetical protein